MKELEVELQRIESKVDLLLVQSKRDRQVLLDSDDLQEQYKQTKHLLKKARDSGELKYLREGNRYYYRREDVERWIANRVI